VALIQHFDHFVVPVDDVVAAEAFYTEVLGASIATFADGTPMRRGLAVQHFQAGIRPHTFFSLAGKRIGVYLQCEPRPQPASVHGGPTYSFETTAAGLAELAALLVARGIAIEGPLDDDGRPAARSVFFNDPAGNHYHVFVPSTSLGTGPAAANDTAANGRRLTAVGYVRLEAPDVEASVRFYVDTFGLEVVGIGTNVRCSAREATLRMPSGQLLFLIESPYGPKGMERGWNVPGPHLAFRVQSADWNELIERLAARDIRHGDVLPEHKKGRRPEELDTYLSDPAGYRLQLAAEGVE
jgi:catechol 2,3-dioxygenase-like lactoylglutathione lyase family enzyme